MDAWLDTVEKALHARVPGWNAGMAVGFTGSGKGVLPQTMVAGEGRCPWDDRRPLTRYYRRTGSRLEILARRGYGARVERRHTAACVVVTEAERRPGRDETRLVEEYLHALSALAVEITDVETEPTVVWKREAPGTPFALPHGRMLFSVGLRRVERWPYCPPPPCP
jgi:hypothetical protein